MKNEDLFPTTDTPALRAAIKRVKAHPLREFYKERPMTLTRQQIADLKAQADAQAPDPLTTQLPFPDTYQPLHWSYKYFQTEEEAVMEEME